MTRHDPKVSLAHMRDHAIEAVNLVSGYKREDLDYNRIIVLALTRLLEIIGEAAARVPSSVRTSYPDIPWTEIIGTRNRLIHGYDKVDLDILWEILQKDLPRLIAILPDLELGH